MKKIIICAFLLLNLFSSLAQMNKADSALSINLWNEISWNIPAANYPVPYKYSTGESYLVFISNSKGLPIQATSYYFDGNVAMCSRMFSTELDSLSAYVNNYNIVTNTYYPSGTIRSSEYHLIDNRLCHFYNQKQKCYYKEQIADSDTVTGIFLTRMNSDFNIEFRVFEKGKYVGTLITDFNMIFVSSLGSFSALEQKRYLRILKKINEKPYGVINY